jgi:hypothetical protein
MTAGSSSQAVEVDADPSAIADEYRRLLAALYLLFAIAAASRATYQLTMQYHRAPLAYVLSAIAGACAIRRTSALARSWTARIAAVELVGLLGVGTVSLVHSEWFPDATV